MGYRGHSPNARAVPEGILHSPRLGLPYCFDRAFGECPGVLIAFGPELEFPGVFFVGPGADTYFQGYLFLGGEGFDFIDYTTDDTVVFVIGSAGL